jgi:hypothetical protein
VHVTLLSHPPPVTDRANGKSGGIMIGANTNPSKFIRDVIDTASFFVACGWQ